MGLEFSLVLPPNPMGGAQEHGDNQTVNFDDNTLQLLDSRQRVLTNRQLVKLAEMLKLDTSPPPAQGT
jgi:hypothetical protein